MNNNPEPQVPKPDSRLYLIRRLRYILGTELTEQGRQFYFNFPNPKAKDWLIKKNGAPFSYDKMRGISYKDFLKYILKIT